MTKNKKIAYFSIIGVIIVIGVILTLSINQVTALQTTIPPLSTTITTVSNPEKNGFSKIIIDGLMINATQAEDTLTIITPGHITTSISNKTITFKVTQMSCPVLQGIKGVDSSGNFICGVI